MTAEEKREKYGTMICVRVSLDLLDQINRYREENAEYNWSAYIKQCIIEKLEEGKNANKQK